MCSQIITIMLLLKLPDSEAEAEAKQKIESNHVLNCLSSSYFVEDNLVHVHSEVEESSRYAQSLKGSIEGERCNCDCCVCFDWCKWCTLDCSGLQCCCKGKEPYSTTWKINSKSQKGTERLARILSEPSEAQNTNATVKLPFQKMQREMTGGTESEASVKKVTHTIFLAVSDFVL